MATNGLPEYREQLQRDGGTSRFMSLRKFRDLGATDYFAALSLFGRRSSGLKEAALSGHAPAMAVSWTTDAASGFTDQHIQTLKGTLPALATALRAVSIEQTATDLLAVYLGRNASARVLSGNIARGSLERIRAVILFYDLRGFTKLSEVRSGEHVINMLNDYFGVVVPVIEAHGGNVLKYMGDGLLAIIDVEDNAAAHAAAIDAAISIREVCRQTTESREGLHLPATGFSLAIHVGEVLYGNIGSTERLDFTVIGPAVNAAARIKELCGTLGQDIVVSRDVASPVLSSRPELVSLGHHDLRGIPEPLELFRLVP
jgi:adenylate cyclase